jgi:hypothetical protein
MPYAQQRRRAGQDWKMRGFDRLAPHSILAGGKTERDGD